MPEPVWYYAQGDEEKGPVSGAQLKSMANSGTIKPDDLVWKEGMDDWAPASDVKGLFPEPPPAEPPKPDVHSSGSHKSDDQSKGKPVITSRTAQAGETPDFQSSDDAPRVAIPLTGPPSSGPVVGPRRVARRSSGSAISVSELIRVGGYVLLLTGMLLAVASKGCDMVGHRRADLLQAQADSERRSFEFEAQGELSTLEAEISTLEDKSNRTAIESDRLASLNSQRSELRDKQTSERNKFLAGRHRELTYYAEDAKDSNTWWSYYRSIVFVFGSLVLSVGLIGVAAVGDNAQRWICLIMLAIVTFSIYVGGVAWLGLDLPG